MQAAGKLRISRLTQELTLSDSIIPAPIRVTSSGMTFDILGKLTSEAPVI